MAVPSIRKVVLNSSFGKEAVTKTGAEREKLHNLIATDLSLIAGQHTNLAKSKKSIAGFKVREEMPLGLTVTLRGEKMYAFLERFIKLALPRIRDFRGLNPNTFDKHGNYNTGISEQLVFPEIDFDTVDQRRGFNITIVTTSNNQKESYILLKELGVPFAKV
jgi:large subunit ribosomal protein L5